MTDMTLQEIADELGISKQMVAKIEKRAIAKATAILEEHGLSWEDFAEEVRAYEEAQDTTYYETVDWYGEDFGTEGD